jgi:hypothetical protein
VSSLKGGDDLARRLKALKVSFKPIGRKWGRAAINHGRPMVPVRTGRLRRSMRITSASEKRTRVGAHYTAYFIDAGVQPHTINPRGGNYLVFPIGGQTIFARQVHHRGFRARPFRRRMAEEGLRDTPMAQEIIDAWNKAS